MKEKVKSNKKNFTKKVIILLIISGFVSYIYLFREKYLTKEKELIKIEKKLKTVEEKLKKETEKNNNSTTNDLDVNSILVQSLYNKVSDGGKSSDCGSNWMYGDTTSKEGPDFNIETATKNQIMSIVGHNLSKTPEKELCPSDNKIPDTIKSLNNSKYKNTIKQLSSRGYFSTCKEEGFFYKYSKNYIENIYHDIYGADKELDLSVPVDTNQVQSYIYIKDIDAYVLYVNHAGGTCSKPSDYKLIKATENNHVIKLYEEVTHYTLGKDFKTSTDSKKIVQVYTFKLDNDGKYSYISRIKQK